MRWEQAHRSVGLLYFLFGIVVISWIPRLPEVKAQLGVSASQFGLILSIGTAGSLAGTLLMGHIINRVGSRPVVFVALMGQLILINLLVHIHSPAIFAPLFVIYVGSGATIALALNAQGTHLNDLLHREVMGRLHGLWSVGALGAGVVASAIAESVSLVWQVSTITAAIAPIIWWAIRRTLSPAEERAQAHDEEIPHFNEIFRPSKLIGLLAIALTGGALIEYASGDWAAIYAREVMGASLSASGLAFTSMMIGLTGGRFAIDRLVTRFGPRRVIRAGATVIIIGVITLAPIASRVVEQNQTMALGLTYLGFALVGLGSSGMMPIFITAAASMGRTARSVVLAQIAVLQSVMIWGHKAIIAFLAGTFSLPTALLWPAITAAITFAFASLTEMKQSTQPTPAQSPRPEADPR